MKIKQLFLGVILMSSLMVTAQTSQEEIAKIAKEQSDGILTSAQSGTKTVYNDGKEVVTTVYNDAKSLTPKIANGINEIAKGLKIGAESVWKILIRQQLVWSITILLSLIGTILSWIHFWYRFNIACENDWGRSGSGHYELICIMCAVISISGSVLVVIHFNDMITGFLNPEYGAMRDIVLVALKLQ